MRHCVVGGGILGVATARLLALTRPSDDGRAVGARIGARRASDGPQTPVRSKRASITRRGVAQATLCRRGAELMIAYATDGGCRLTSAARWSSRSSEDELPRLTSSNACARQRRAGTAATRCSGPAGDRAARPGIAALHSPRERDHRLRGGDAFACGRPPRGRWRGVALARTSCGSSRGVRRLPCSRRGARRGPTR